jgi:hypothetical protein
LSIAPIRSFSVGGIMFAGIVLTGSIGVLAIVLTVALLGNETLLETVSEAIPGIGLLGILVFVAATIWEIVRGQSNL